MNKESEPYFDEIVLPGGHTIIREKRPTCDKCGEEMTNIMFYGWVCVFCDKPK